MLPATMFSVVIFKLTEPNKLKGLGTFIVAFDKENTQK